MPSRKVVLICPASGGPLRIPVMQEKTINLNVDAMLTFARQKKFESRNVTRETRRKPRSQLQSPSPARKIVFRTVHALIQRVRLIQARLLT